MAKMEFTDPEYRELVKLAANLAKTRKDLSTAEWNKPQHAAVKIFIKKFSAAEPAADSYMRGLNRTEMRIIQQMLQAAVEAINTSILPTYRQRQHDQPDRHAFYQEYVTRAELVLNTYNDVLKKVEGKL